MRVSPSLLAPVLLASLALVAGCAEQGTTGAPRDDDGRTASAVPSGSSTAAPRTPSSSAGGAAQFRPVVGVPGPEPDGGCDAPRDASPEDPVSATDAAGEFCYELGPALFVLDDRQTVEATEQAGTGEPVIVIELPADQAEQFGEYTATHIGEAIALLVDGTVVTAPTIQSAITDGEIVVSGQFTVAEAEDLAARLGGP